ncbi:unnamed protein product [Amoebophrya sp. A120]|nr:unnamed protein product [Amoebophrya sp. A120]|eukprot:GSA120T00012590001.1
MAWEMGKSMLSQWIRFSKDGGLLHAGGMSLGEEPLSGTSEEENCYDAGDGGGTGTSSSAGGINGDASPGASSATSAPVLHDGGTTPVDTASAQDSDAAQRNKYQGRTSEDDSQAGDDVKKAGASSTTAKSKSADSAPASSHKINMQKEDHTLLYNSVEEDEDPQDNFHVDGDKETSTAESSAGIKIDSTSSATQNQGTLPDKNTRNYKQVLHRPRKERISFNTVAPNPKKKKLIVSLISATNSDRTEVVKHICSVLWSLPQGRRDESPFVVAKADPNPRTTNSSPGTAVGDTMTNQDTEEEEDGSDVDERNLRMDDAKEDFDSRVDRTLHEQRRTTEKYVVDPSIIRDGTRRISIAGATATSNGSARGGPPAQQDAPVEGNRPPPASHYSNNYRDRISKNDDEDHAKRTELGAGLYHQNTADITSLAAVNMHASEDEDALYEYADLMDDDLAVVAEQNHLNEHEDRYDNARRSHQMNTHLEENANQSFSEKESRDDEEISSLDLEDKLHQLFTIGRASRRVNYPLRSTVLDPVGSFFSDWFRRFKQKFFPMIPTERKSTFGSSFEAEHLVPGCIADGATSFRKHFGKFFNLFSWSSARAAGVGNNEKAGAVDEEREVVKTPAERQHGDEIDNRRKEQIFSDPSRAENNDVDEVLVKQSDQQLPRKTHDAHRQKEWTKKSQLPEQVEHSAAERDDNKKDMLIRADVFQDRKEARPRVLTSGEQQTGPEEDPDAVEVPRTVVAPLQQPSGSATPSTSTKAQHEKLASFFQQAAQNWRDPSGQVQYVVYLLPPTMSGAGGGSSTISGAPESSPLSASASTGFAGGSSNAMKVQQRGHQSDDGEMNLSSPQFLKKHQDLVRLFEEMRQVSNLILFDICGPPVFSGARHLSDIAFVYDADVILPNLIEEKLPNLDHALVLTEKMFIQSENIWQDLHVMKEYFPKPSPYNRPVAKDLGGLSDSEQQKVEFLGADLAEQLRKAGGNSAVLMNKPRGSSAFSRSELKQIAEENRKQLLERKVSNLWTNQFNWVTCRIRGFDGVDATGGNKAAGEADGHPAAGDVPAPSGSTSQLSVANDDYGVDPAFNYYHSEHFSYSDYEDNLFLWSTVTANALNGASKVGKPPPVVSNSPSKSSSANTEQSTAKSKSAAAASSAVLADSSFVFDVRRHRFARCLAEADPGGDALHVFHDTDSGSTASATGNILDPLAGQGHAAHQTAGSVRGEAASGPATRVEHATRGEAPMAVGDDENLTTAITGGSAAFVYGRAPEVLRWLSGLDFLVEKCGSFLFASNLNAEGPSGMAYDTVWNAFTSRLSRYFGFHALSLQDAGSSSHQLIFSEAASTSFQFGLSWHSKQIRTNSDAPLYLQYPILYNGVQQFSQHLKQTSWKVPNCKEFKQTNNMDVKGYDITGSGGATSKIDILSCQAACQADKECDTFVFASGAKMCYLKTRARGIMGEEKQGLVLAQCTHDRG